MAISVTNCGDASKMRKKDGVGTGNTQLENLTVTGTTTVADPVNDTDAVNQKALNAALENVVLSVDVEEVESPTVGHVPTLTEDGQLQDSGKTIDELGGAFIITYDRTTNTADKTYDEMEAAYNSGKELILRYDYPGFKEQDLKLSYVFKKGYATRGYSFTFAGGSENLDGDVFPYMIASFGKSSDFINGKWTFCSSATLPQVDENYDGAILMVNGNEWAAVYPPFAPKPTTITGTLTAGSTSLVLSNSAITTDSTIDIYTDKWGVNPTDVVVATGKVTLTFEAQAAALNVKVEVK